jgi:prostaglandin-H2 D-isomerase / glutathione transferase
MAQYKLTYFDFSGSRGEECRMALFVAGVDFEDHRIQQAAWPALKPETPFGALPILEASGKPALAQSNAILTYVGRRYDLLPSDPWEAARHQALLDSVEELRAALAPTGKHSDPAQKQQAREEFANGFLKTWSANVERQVRGPFFGGAAISVADIKLFQIMGSFKKGILDHIPTTVFGPFPKLEGAYAAVAAHPRIVAWQARH